MLRLVSGLAVALGESDGEIRPASILEAAEERVVRLILDQTRDVEGEFADVVVAPHAGFVTGDLLTFGNVIPAVGLVVDRVEEQAVVSRVDAEVGVGQERAQGGKTGLVVTLAVLGVGAEVATEANEALGADGCR